MIEISLFNNFYPTILQIIDNYLQTMTVDFVRQHFIELLNYSTEGGKKIRGILVASAYCELNKIEPKSKEAYPGFILGWALEILQAAYLVADDLMDQSQTRRGKPCWYLKPNVGNSAVNDALIVENLAFVLIDSLKMSINNSESIPNLPDEVIDKIASFMRQMNLKTTIGQSLDYKCKTYLEECYSIIITHKTAYYTIYEPIMIAIIASQKVPEEIRTEDTFTQFLLKIGYFFQAQDDFLDVYGDSTVTGKIGSDISEGKVTWIACQAFKHANEQQKAQLEENLGKNSPESIQTVKNLYDILHIPQIFHEYSQGEQKALKDYQKVINHQLPVNTINELIEILISRKS